jgi:uncharacterized membrane protein
MNQSNGRRLHEHTRSSPRRRWSTKLAGWTEALEQHWWPLPMICVAIAILLLEVASAIDVELGSNVDRWYVFGGGPPSARSVLSVIASSTLTFAGLVFSVTMVVLQLASSQFSPRVIRTFLRDRMSQAALGIFAGTFVYALLGLRKVHDGFENVSIQVPAFTVWTAVMMAIGCVVTFVLFVHHVANAIRASVVIQRIGAETRTALQRLHPEGIGAEKADPIWRPPTEVPDVVVPWSAASGVLQFVDEERIIRCAEQWDIMVFVTVEVGEFVAQGAPLLELWGNVDAVQFRELIGALHVGGERTMQQDGTFGFRQLADVALRALSPSLNDPTTAIQAIHELHQLLRYLARRRLAEPNHVSSDGRLRLVVRHPDWASYVRSSMEELRQSANDSTRVLAELRNVAKNIAGIAPPHRRAELERQITELNAALARLPHESEPAAATFAD